MDATPSDMAAISRFSIQFTFFLTLWNQCEATARRILQLMLGEGQTAMGLAVEIQNRSLSNALRTGALDRKFKEVRPHLEHLVEGYDRILAYRNYYAHSLLAATPSGGVLLSISAKGALKFDKATATAEDMEKLKNHASDWIGYAAAIEKELGATGDGLDNLMKAYQSSLQKPTWPNILKKNPALLQ